MISLKYLLRFVSKFIIILVGIAFQPALAELNNPSIQNTYTNTHLFTDYGNIQSTQQQVLLLNDKAPLPFSIFGSVQKWTTGPAQDNLITQVAQGLYKVNHQWKIIASELYQKQGNINLSNTVLGFNYQPDPHISINSSVGVGTAKAYTYKYSLLFSPEYKFPEFKNRTTLSTSATFNYQEFSLGSFRQIIPKINWQASEYMPPLSLGYAIGTFQNNSSEIINQYYQPKTINGALISASLRTTERSFFIISYYPYNKNIIGGYTTTQDTLGATINYKVLDKVHVSVFSQYQNTRGSSVNLALGGSINFAF